MGRFITVVFLTLLSGLILFHNVCASDESVSNILYEEAVNLRAQQSISKKEHQKAISLLILAAGLGLNPGSREVYLFPSDAKISSAQPQPGPSLPGFPGIHVPDDTHAGALRELAKAFRDGFGVEQHHVLSLELFRRASNLGDPEAQGQMGMRYALGLQEASSWDESGIKSFGQPDEESAMLHYYYGAVGGDDFSRMALGYRHMHGIGVPKSCWTAASYYQPVAEKTADLSTKPGTLPQVERIRLYIQSSQGLKADRHREVVQYYQYSADRGNVDAQTAVGQVLNYGTHGVQRDHVQALHYFQRAAEAGDHDAMAHLGHMYANGYGTAQNYAQAQKWFQSAATHGSASAQYGLGYMHLTGQGMTEDHEKAFKFFSQAAEQGHADAHFYMGIMHLKGLGVRRKSVQRAFSYFTLASHAGHVLAMYNAATMHLSGKGTIRTCKPALLLMKQISERGPPATSLQLGHEHFFHSQYRQSLLHYLEAAEMGMELGQSNAAWMLNRGYVRAGGLLPNVTFSLEKRSADQGNVASLLRMGDAYLYGEGVEQDWIRSAAVYYEAYQERSAEAMFNLGYMHEFGIGVPKDLKLARRFYNMAKHTQSDASIAVYIANAWLSVHEAWDAVYPYVPPQLVPFWSRVSTLHPPHTTILGPWAAVLKGALRSQALFQAELGLWRVVDATGVIPLVTALLSGEAGKDFSETAVLLAMVIVLYVVLRARRQRAAARGGQGDAAQAGFMGQDMGAVPGIRQADAQFPAGGLQQDAGTEQQQDPARGQAQDGAAH
mmetsp:Transcript_12326/g.26616  ORF Transcript_12326/g.26616 Transcript_12326/m.26616 type:complete len:777 (-) Transcript_12326:145-2475(-)